MSSFTEEQDKAIHASIDHPIAIVACPGSGKTFTIINRIAHLIQSGINADKMLVITFTRKAAQELRQRLTNMGLDVKKLSVLTFHSFGRTILMKYGSLLGIQKFRLITENEQFQILSGYLPSPESADKKQLLLALQLYKATKKCENEEAQAIFDKYIQELLSKQLVDFTDLITYPLEILRNNKYALEYYRRRFEYCLVDEMQDVSQAQFDLIHTLFNETGRITVVGDDDQTIYGWRGADSSLLLQFQTKFTNAEMLTLSTCFRCPTFVIKAMSEVIRNNKVRVKKSIKSGIKEPLGKKKINVIGALNQEREAVLVCDAIEKEAQKNPQNTISILFRTRKQSEKIIQELKKRKIQTAKNQHKFEGRSFDIISNILLMIGGRAFDEKMVDERIMKKLSPNNSVEEIINRFQSMKIRSIVDTISDILDLRDPIVNDIIMEAENYDENINPGDFADELKTSPSIFANSDSIVSLTTVHQAKGLEWDSVFIVGASQGSWPSNRSKDREEERRLFYVAMSRARKNLTISFSQQAKASPFLGEISDFFYDLFIEKEDEEKIEEEIEKKKEERQKQIENLPGFQSVRAMKNQKDEKIQEIPPPEKGQLTLGFVSAKTQQNIQRDAPPRNRPHLDLVPVVNKPKEEKNPPPRIAPPRGLGAARMLRLSIQNSTKPFVPPKKIDNQ